MLYAFVRGVYQWCYLYDYKLIFFVEGLSIVFLFQPSYTNVVGVIDSYLFMALRTFFCNSNNSFHIPLFSLTLYDAFFSVWDFTLECFCLTLQPHLLIYLANLLSYLGFGCLQIISMSWNFFIPLMFFPVLLMFRANYHFYLHIGITLIFLLLLITSFLLRSVTVYTWSMRLYSWANLRYLFFFLYPSSSVAILIFMISLYLYYSSWYI